MSNSVISPPKKGRKKRLPAPPKENQQQSHNLSKKTGDKKVQLHFESTASEKKELKILSAQLGMTMTDIWKEAFEDFKRKHGFQSDNLTN